MIFCVYDLVPDELDVVVMSDSPGAVISDPVDHSYANVLNGPQQVFVGNQISKEAFDFQCFSICKGLSLLRIFSTSKRSFLLVKDHL